MVLFQDSGLDAPTDDVLVGGFLEVDQYADGDLANEDNDQEDEELGEEELIV